MPGARPRLSSRLKEGIPSLHPTRHTVSLNPLRHHHQHSSSSSFFHPSANIFIVDNNHLHPFFSFRHGARLSSTCRRHAVIMLPKSLPTPRHPSRRVATMTTQYGLLLSIPLLHGSPILSIISSALQQVSYVDLTSTSPRSASTNVSMTTRPHLQVCNFVPPLYPLPPLPT